MRLGKGGHRSFALNNKTDEPNNRLTGDKSKYIKAMIDRISKFFLKRDQLLVMHPEKASKSKNGLFLKINK